MESQTYIKHLIGRLECGNITPNKLIIKQIEQEQKKVRIVFCIMILPSAPKYFV